MNERYDPETLLAYVEGELPSPQREALERQLADDERLRRLIEQLRADRDALRELPTEAPPRDLLADATQQLERDMLIGPAPERAPTPPAAAAGHRDGIVRRIHWGRTLTYGALAAMVALSAGVLTIALTDTTLLQQASQFAQVHEPTAPQRTEREPAPGVSEPTTAPPDEATALAEVEAEIAAQLDAAAPLALRIPMADAPIAGDPSATAAAVEPPAVAPLAAAQAESAPEPIVESELGPPRPEVPEGSVMARVPRAAEGRPDDTAAFEADRLDRSADLATQTQAPETQATADAPQPDPLAPDRAAPDRIEVVTRSAARTQGEILEWVRAHGASMTLDGHGLTLRLAANQLDDLVAHLNREPTEQRAALATAAAPDAPEEPREADEPEEQEEQEEREESEPAIEQWLHALEATESIEADSEGDSDAEPAEIVRETTHQETSVTLGRAWSQRDRLVQAFADALAAQRAKREAEAAPPPTAKVHEPWRPALDWRERIAAQLTPAPPKPTIELAVMIEEIPDDE